ncbi:ATP-binding protein [Mesorhizobium sp. BAC0120]|uniref:sensor histidine kinase n=1 Tax=Mesorhizobium sp. BAC0120 TaxID=3090670 RepID=UPI00298D5650|nr:ATP-binding protein [Mesorhizobium sp. BAC0120]MDW6023356.1 ATP-binding protein [Mesorhizobium sp. BAC0120]
MTFRPDFSNHRPQDSQPGHEWVSCSNADNSGCTDSEERRDWTDFDSATENLLQLSQQARTIRRLAALGEMAGGIAHDFRNLLAAIESGLRLAERNADEPEQVRAYFAAMRDGIHRGFELTSQLLAFAKHRKLDAHFGDVNEFLKTFEPLLRYGAGPDINVRFRLASDIPTCLVDPALFDAAILNLVANARDAMPAGGVIEIATERFVQQTTTSDPPGSRTYVRIRVKDWGCGIAPDVLERVFDPFFTTKGEKGTGIGLPQVHAFAEMFCGYVQIASEQGIGTTVDLFLPSAELDL